MNKSELEILAADWVAPMDGRLIRRGAVAVSGGRIVGVGGEDEIVASFPGATVHPLGQVVLMPGLVNAHTHLELSACRCPEKFVGTFTDWILALPRRGAMDEAELEASVSEATQIGVRQCLQFGVTCVGDISQYPRFSRAVLSNSGLRAVSYAEVLGVGPRRPRFEQLLANAAADLSGMDEISKLRGGVSPHAPYSVDRAGYIQCLELARRLQLPLATHLSEWPEEKEFLVSHAGMFREALTLFGSWDEGIETYRGSPVRFASAIGLLDYPALLAHVNYCDEEEMQLLAAGRASVVYCPRTHRFFGHPPHRWRQMLAMGINVAVGTDSCASSPDLNLVDEIRLMHEIAPEFPTEGLWRLITANAAAALGRADVGQIAKGKLADLIAFEVDSGDPLLELLQTQRDPAAIWIAGAPQ